MRGEHATHHVARGTILARAHPPDRGRGRGVESRTQHDRIVGAAFGCEMPLAGDASGSGMFGSDNPKLQKVDGVWYILDTNSGNK